MPFTSFEKTSGILETGKSLCPAALQHDHQTSLLARLQFIGMPRRWTVRIVRAHRDDDLICAITDGYTVAGNSGLFVQLITKME